MGQELRLREFQQLYREWSKGIFWYDYLLLAVFVWLEEKFLNLRIKCEIDQAIKGFESAEVQPESLVKPIYSETGSDFFDEMRLTAPFKK